MEKPTYHRLPKMIEMMDPAFRGPCHRLYAENRELFASARGSTHNHQTWPGGYLDHVTDAMNYAILFYRADASTGRPMPYSLSDALVAVYLHDLEKPWRFVRKADGSWENTGLMKDKAGRAAFRWAKIAEYGIPITPEIENAIRYAEGEGDDYRPDRRVANELAGFVHVCDTYSARTRHDFPAFDDPWSQSS